MIAFSLFDSHQVLRRNSGVDEGLGDIHWHLAVCLLAAWIIVFLCLIKGIKSAGKVVRDKFYLSKKNEHIA